MKWDFNTVLNDPKFCDRLLWLNSVDTSQTLTTWLDLLGFPVLASSLHNLEHYSVIKPQRLNWRIILQQFWWLLHIKVRLPILLCTVKTVECDFRFCWTISSNIGQTHSENPNFVIYFLHEIYIKWYIQTVQQITQTLIHQHQFTSLCRGQKPAAKMHQTYIWNTCHMQSIAGPVLASAVWTYKRNNTKLFL